MPVRIKDKPAEIEDVFRGWHAHDRVGLLIDACERAARVVLEEGAMKLVVVHCPSSALVLTRDGERTVLPSIAIPESEIMGANGAGDAFAAGMLYGIHESWSTEDSLRIDHGCAAVSLRSVSTTGAIVSWRECLELAQRWGSRAFPPSVSVVRG
ncbi:sugar/nucleoside kinase (ribokinase family) [Pararhizobium capsulatum DSM 1112]|uniref:Sugar/nucleoside kinase (Ribokinase family) n=1 Tax=Pararhizobium capsulatum DSM 1112 TaxID=1121113 RepID=A0ABU0C065_9HYPH|nr:PfkB family carbohydrate kinase [Pararhizobium capsulatum]MDQ0323301.1 sugar/nucleoside kinase (ribokinase family) [Pararhizobium capsulatum DSM 1112]